MCNTLEPLGMLLIVSRPAPVKASQISSRMSWPGASCAMHVSFSSCATASQKNMINNQSGGCTDFTNAVGESRAREPGSVGPSRVCGSLACVQQRDSPQEAAEHGDRHSIIPCSRSRVHAGEDGCTAKGCLWTGASATRRDDGACSRVAPGTDGFPASTLKRLALCGSAAVLGAC